MSICGYEIDVDALAEDYFGDKPLSWERWEQISDTGSLNTYSCQRTTWKDSDRCVWHAESDYKPIEDFDEQSADEPERLDGAKISNLDARFDFENCSLQQAEFRNVELEHSNFKDADLRGVEFIEYCNFQGSDFQNARLEDAEASGVNFSSCNFHNAELLGDFSDALFSGADLSKSKLGTNFSESSFYNSDLTDCNAQRVDFSGASLGGANLTRADIREATLQGARLYQAQLSDIQINDRTDFGKKTVYETDEDIDIIIDTSWNVHRFEAAAWVYKRLQSICQDHALSSKAREFHVRKREARRKLAWSQHDLFSIVVSETDRIFTRHGESSRRVLGWSFGTILTSTLFYAIGGVSYDDRIYTLYLEQSMEDVFYTISMSLYFSISSFSTGGYGDVLPASDLSRVVAGFESLVGTLFIALFIFVLGRRVTW